MGYPWGALGVDVLEFQSLPMLTEVLALAELEPDVALDEAALLDDDAPVLPQPASMSKLTIVAAAPSVISNLFFILLSSKCS